MQETNLILKIYVSKKTHVRDEVTQNGESERIQKRSLGGERKRGRERECVCVCVRERERETERKTERQREVEGRRRLIKR